MLRREPESIFTPNAIARADMFERRNEPDRVGNPGLQDRMVESIRQPGAQLRVFGETGVGKTSLVAFAAAETARKALTVECRSSQDFADIVEQAINRIQGVRLTSYMKHRIGSAESEAEGKIPFLATIKGNVSVGTGKERSFEVVQKSPLDLLIDLMAERGYTLLVLDNFQNVIDIETRTEIAQMMEILSDRAATTGDLKLIVVGIAEDAHTLLTPAPSVRRRTVDVGVPGMPDEEIRAILETGFRLLGLKAEPDLLDHAVFFSDGFPFFAHTIGLNVARAARRAESNAVGRRQFAAGLLRTLNEVDETYAGRIRLAADRGGNLQAKRRILRLLAESTKRTWSARDVEALWRDNTRAAPPRSPSVGALLGALAKDENGGVLRRDEAIRPFRYRFSDPYFRTYIRLEASLGATSEDRAELLRRDDREIRNPPVSMSDFS